MLSSLHAQDSLRMYYSSSLDAYKQKDYPTYLKYAKRANELRPNHPILAYNIASAYALNGEHDKALSALASYLRMNASTDYQQDEDFTSLRQDSRFTQLSALVAEQTKSIQNSTVSFTLDQTKHHFESITYDSEKQAFYLGTITTRSILQYRSGKPSILLSSLDYPNLYGVMGLDVGDNTLWVCTAALPEITGYKSAMKNKSSVFAIDLDTREVICSYSIDEAILGDLIVLNDGSVLASDGLGNKLYKFTLTGFELVADFSDQIFNFQGLAYHQNALYLSDYITGLYAYDFDNQDLVKIKSNNLYAEKGTDGVLFHGDRLICFQNGTNPKRTFEVFIDDHEATSVEIIDQNLNPRGEPTQGVIVNGAVFYISNSAWDAYKETQYNPDSLDILLEIRKFWNNKGKAPEN